MASRTWKCVPCGKAFQSSQPRTVGRNRPAWTTSPWTWASLGGVVVAVTFSLAVIANHRGPARAVAKGPANSTVDAPVRPATPPTDAVAATAEGRTIDLLPLIDLTRD